MYVDGWFSTFAFFPVVCTENLRLLNAFSHRLTSARPVVLLFHSKPRLQLLGALDSDQVLKLSNAAAQRVNLNTEKAYKMEVGPAHRMKGNSAEKSTETTIH